MQPVNFIILIIYPPLTVDSSITCNELMYLCQGGDYGESREARDVPDDTSRVSRAGDDVPATSVDGHAGHNVRVVDGGGQVAASCQAVYPDAIVPVATAEKVPSIVGHRKHVTAQLNAWVEWPWYLSSRPETAIILSLSGMRKIFF